MTQPCVNVPTEYDDLDGRARRRVQRSPRLRKYASIIFYEWFPATDHLRWVISARVGEIESWAKQIQEDSDADR
jgi:hypothetical protein